MPSILRSKRRASRPPPLETTDSLDTSEFGSPSKLSLSRAPTSARTIDSTTAASSVKSSDRAASPFKPETPRLVVTQSSSNGGSSSNIGLLSPVTAGTILHDIEPVQDTRTTNMSEEPGSILVSPPQATEHPGRNPNRDSLVARVAERLNSPNGTESKKKRKHRSRRASTSSAISQGQTIAAALAKSALNVAAADEQLTKPTARSISTGRSPYLLSQHDYDSDDEYGSDEESEHGSDTDALDHLPVTGFAVASNRRNAEFHAMFPSVDEGDYLIEDYGCALAKDILVHGRLYVSENHICFHSNLFGWVTDLVIPFSEVTEIEKKMTALVIPNAIGIITAKEKYTFASLISRDSTFDVLKNIWHIAHPGATMGGTPGATNGASRPESIAEETEGANGGSQAVAAHRSTECACGKAGKHYTEVALEATFPSSPEKVYNLIFNSGWSRTFLSENQKLRDIETSEWRPDENKQLARTMTYIKPLNGSIGPKQTKCHITDVHEHCDFDEYISMITTTRTPDVPSGGVFSVKTRTCFSWASATTTRMVVTTEVEWTGKSWVKGIIEKSAIDGQKQFHDDLAREIRSHIKEHPTEFAVAGAESVEESDAVPDKEAGPAPTEAQEYAAQNRRARQDTDYWLLQGAFDNVLSGLKSIGSGIGTALSTISDLLEGSPGGKASFMFGLIVLLLASNIYTYLHQPASQHRQKRLQRFGPTEDDVNEAVAIILAKRAATTPQQEVKELIRLLDEIDSRSAKMRASLLETLKPAAERAAGNKRVATEKIAALD